ncbi:reticulon-1-like isoform X2 [Sitophilus oryzae]|uniref:Reticulon-like protein n=1 Tax=Sitophilus oryzae TaxID=7048 RepID=A0A6J2YV80_SITOR|nr:reticulon-1-like isoform X2 [Sitophilus oryzae]
MDHLKQFEPPRFDSESPDDFEHLGHDSSPLQEFKQHTEDLLGLKSSGEDTHERHEKIDKQEKNEFNTAAGDSLLDQPLIPQKMESLVDLNPAPFSNRNENEENINRFLKDMTDPFASVQPQEVSFNASNINSFLNNERGGLKEPHHDEVLEKYSDSEPESDEFRFNKPEEVKKSVTDNVVPAQTKTETFKDIPELPHKDYEEILKEEPKQSKVEPVKEPEPVKIQPKIVPEKKPADLPAPQKTEVCAKKLPGQKFTDAEALFCKMGLVESLIYWRDPKKSGPVFGGVLLVLLALTYFSFISVIAYLSLFALTGTIAFRIYKNIIQAVQKTGDGHPFKEYLELDVALPQDKVKEISEVAVAHLNAGVSELRRLFLVEDLVDSIKFGVFLWVLTYLGSWFNGMTLVIIAWVALFTLPKVYEANQAQIDANLDIVRSKLTEITAKVKAAIPIGKKSEEKKE